MLDFHTDDRAGWLLATDQLLEAVRWRRVHSSAAAKTARKSLDGFAEWLASDEAFPGWKATGSVPDPLWQVLWSQHAFPESDHGRTVSGRSRTLAGVLEHFAANTARRTRREMVRMILHEFDGAAPADPFELLGLLTLLRTRAAELPSETRLALWRTALLSARDFVTNIDNPPPGLEPADQHLVRHGELPLLVGRVFHAVQGSTQLRRSGRSMLATLVDEETDTDGTPHGRILDRLPYFLAGMVRAVSSRRDIGKPTFNATLHKRFASLVRQSALLVGRDGHSALSSAEIEHPASLIHAAMSVAELPPRDPARRTMAAVPSELADSQKGQAANSKKSSAKLPKFSVASGQSEWGGLATFRGDFGSPRCVMTVDFHGSCPRLAIQLDGRTVISGEWSVSTTVSGVPLDEADGWSSVCWYSDDEADYLELQADLPGDRQLTRHLIYAHDDAVLLLAASARNVGQGDIESTMSLPLASGVSVEADKRDRLMQIKKPIPCRVVPLGLEADPFRSTVGQIGADDSSITIQQMSDGDGLCVPVLIDLKPKNKYRKSIEWRRLTVAEAGSAVPRGRADGYRLRLGDHEDSPQWVYYQSMAAPEVSRTVLGMHTPYEMVFGRFEDGEIDPLVHVENDDE